MKDVEGNQQTKRDSERLPLAAEVQVAFQSEPVSGSGKNISANGVFFIADEEVRVTVRIGDRDVEGQLVRAESRGGGKTGLAVKFADGAFD